MCGCLTRRGKISVSSWNFHHSDVLTLTTDAAIFIHVQVRAVNSPTVHFIGNPWKLSVLPSGPMKYCIESFLESSYNCYAFIGPTHRPSGVVLTFSGFLHILSTRFTSAELWVYNGFVNLIIQAVFQSFSIHSLQLLLFYVKV